MNKHFCFLLQYEENFVFIYIYINIKNVIFSSEYLLQSLCVPQTLANLHKQKNILIDQKMNNFFSFFFQLQQRNLSELLSALISDICLLRLFARAKYLLSYTIYCLCSSCRHFEILKSSNQINLSKLILILPRTLSCSRIFSILNSYSLENAKKLILKELLFPAVVITDFI